MSNSRHPPGTLHQWGRWRRSGGGRYRGVGEATPRWEPHRGIRDGLWEEREERQKSWEEFWVRERGVLVKNGAVSKSR